VLDPNRQRKIIVVHGVQVGDNDDLHQDDLVRELFSQRLGDLNIDAAVDLYKYENMNNEVLDPLQKIAKHVAETPIGKYVAPAIIDLVGDVVISLANNGISEKIRQGLEQKILGYYEAGNPCYVVAHSHWYKASYVIGSKADEALSVRMGEHRPVTYKKTNDGVVYLGEAKRDIKVIGAAPVDERYVCGKVEGLSSLKEFDGDELALSMHCKAKSSPFSRTQGYLPASDQLYVLKVSLEDKFSFTGARPEAPTPPTCIPRE